MKILIVYENIPESTDIYSIDNLSDEDWQWMKLTHGYYINFDMPPDNQAACEKLWEFLKERGKLFSTEDNKVPEPISALGYDYIIHTGFGM